MRKELLTLHAYDWVVKDEFDDNGHVVINAWCLDRASKPHLLRFHDFPAICTVELPCYVNNKEYRWTKEKANKVFETLCKMLKGEAPEKFFLQQKNKLYYYRAGKTYPVMMLVFTTLKAMFKCKNMVQNALKIDEIGLVYLRVWETNISLERKLLTWLGLNYSQWFVTEAFVVEPNDKISTLECEYIADRQTLKPVPSEETGDWLAKPTILAFDIETYSDRHNSFPQALSAKHAAFNISCIFQRAGEINTRQRVILVYGDSNPIEGVEIIKFSTEIEMIDGFADIINKFDPEILIGYNIFDFDYRYLNTRLTRRRCLDPWKSCGRLVDVPTTFGEFGWSSNGAGHNRIGMLSMDGRISIDMLPIIRRDYKLDKYSLDFVSKHFLDRGKHDVSAKQMFLIYARQQNSHDQVVKLFTQLNYPSHLLTFKHININALEEFLVQANVPNKIEYELALSVYRDACKDMTKVMAYCVEDSVLCLDIFDHINCWVGLLEMSNVVGVTLVQLFTRGQQLRTLSQLYNLSFHDDYVIDERRVTEDNAYSGGFVYPPIPGMYDLIPCLDFKSLYPTIMMAYNICYTTFVPPEHMDSIPDEACHVIEWDEVVEVTGNEEDDDEEEDDTDDGNKKAAKTKLIHYRYKFVKEPKGLVPRLLEQLISQRDKVKETLKHTKDPTVKIVLDKRQLALKISANSMYGGLGASKGKLPLKEAAACVTAKSRESILRVNSYIENKGGCVVYGDSVTGDTPILCRQASRIFFCTIANLFQNQHWVSVSDKEYYTPTTNLEVWSDTGFTTIKHLMRHKTLKRIFRITTQTGCVKVTEDHSLLNDQGSILTPTSLNLTDRLLSVSYPMLPEKGLDLAEAWIYGLIFAAGRCLETDWIVVHPDGELLSRAQELLIQIYPELTFEVGPKILRMSGMVLLEWRTMFYDGAELKKIPDILWTCHVKARQEFCDGYLAGTQGSYEVEGQIGAAGLYFLMNSIGYDVSIQHLKSTGDVYRLNIRATQGYQQSKGDLGIIRGIEDMGYQMGYVYDLETQNHHFSAGIGEIVVHNTDSSMPNLGLKDPKTAYKEAHQWAKELTYLFPKPMELEDEDVFYKLFCITKKKYAAIKMTKDGNPILDPSKMKIRGVLIARRDNCKWQRKIFEHVLWNIMTGVGIAETYDYILEACLALIRRQVPIEDLIIIKGIKSGYKNPSHSMKIFGEELTKAGQQVQPGDRLEYIIVRTAQEQEYERLKYAKCRSKVLLGYKMRNPDLYTQNLDQSTPEPIDYLYYIDNLLKNAIQQIFGVAYMAHLDVTEKEYQTKDVNRVLKEFLLAYPEYQTQYLQLFAQHKGDKEKLIQVLKNSSAKKYIQPFISKYLTRQKGTSRLTKQPIKMLVKHLAKRKLLLEEIRTHQ